MCARHCAICWGHKEMKKTVLAPGCLWSREKKEWEWIWKAGRLEAELMKCCSEVDAYF